MNKKFLITNIIISIFIWGFIYLCIPITKLPTKNALEGIHKNFIKKDLTEEETKNLNFYKNWIICNEKGIRTCLNSSKKAGISLSILLVVNNIILLVKLKKTITTHSP